MSDEKTKWDIDVESHYYGDIVRKLFMGAAIIMVLSLPFFIDRIPVAASVSVLAILLVGIAAGLVSPRYTWTAFFNTLIAACGFVVFEYYAVDAYQKADLFFFWVNQLLAVLFIVAVYYGVKTVRGSLKT